MGESPSPKGRKELKKINKYYADNRQFSDNTFINSVNAQGQTIFYCGVSAHFQNRIDEKRIRDLKEQARNKILHSKPIWSSAIEPNLWPYTLQNTNIISNNLPDNLDTTSPVGRYYQVQVSPKIRCHYTLLCPEYYLKNILQVGVCQPKW